MIHMNRSIPFPLSLLLGVLLSLAACQANQITPEQGDLMALPSTPLQPAYNPSSPEKVALGKLLFYDPILSGEKDVACASCHHPSLAYADGRALSLGVGARGLGPSRQDQSGGRIAVVGRHAPSLINVAYNGLTAEALGDPAEAPMFWDNRMRSLEAQVLGPLLAHNEMRGDAFTEGATLDSLVARLRSLPGYVSRFEEAFSQAGPIDAQQLAYALAAYERSLVAPNSRFDRYLRGETALLSDEEVTGMQQFISRGCATCHGGPMLSDFRLHRLGVANHPAVAASDRGNGQDQFRTPTLRNVTRTAPYMHNGTQATLEEVMQFYNDQQSLHPSVRDNQLAQEFRDLTGMSNRRRDQIIAFLGTLEDDPADVSVPASVPSGLPVGGR
jgi:cytochrome c peroxidase